MIIIKIMIISTAIFKNVIEKLQKNSFFLHNFGGVIAVQSAICRPRLNERCYKITIDHK